MECIILAGGLGTRLKDEVRDVPKCLAPVNGQPFLAYVLNYLESQFIDHVILSLGYKHDHVINWINSKAFTFKLDRVIEKEPLGTGGGIKLALNKAKEKEVFILNGDTLFNIDLREMKKHLDNNVKAVIALKQMEDFERYGSVQLDADKRITAFKEKKAQKKGLINGGIYLLNTQLENLSSFPNRFSFEKDFLEQEVDNKTLKGYENDGYFIDIGIPEDYHRAQTELNNLS